MRLLLDHTNGLIRILDPPLTRAKPDPGYIGAYPPGVRENGAQYSHAGVWGLMAQAALGDADAAYQSFTRLSPAHRSAHPQYGARYQVEPYVMAGDVYSRAAVRRPRRLELVHGFCRVDVQSRHRIDLRFANSRWPRSVTPHLPSHWPRVQLTLRRDGRVHELIICAASAKAEIDQAYASGAVPLAESDWLVLADAGNASRHLVVVGAAARAKDAAYHVE